MLRSQSLRAVSPIEVSTTALRRQSLVVVVAQHDILRHAIAAFLRECFTTATVVESVAADDQTQLAGLLARHPQIILVGLGAPATHGLAVVAQVRAALSDATIVAFGWWDDDVYHQSAQQAGADAFCCTDKLCTQLPDLIHRLLRAER